MLNEKRIQQHLRTFERMAEEYAGGGEPLARFLTGFYKRNRQMGAADRRMASRLMYHYFRLGRAAQHAEPQERLMMAEFLCASESTVVQLLRPDWYPYITEDLPRKRAFLETHTAFRSEAVFPFADHLSSGIDYTDWLDSLFVQPDLFIRMRDSHRDHILSVLDREGIAYERLTTHTLALPNGTALDRLSGIAGMYEVQDLSSQQTGDYFEATPGEYWWDACAGAGGKSLLLLDRCPDVRLLVSDIRNSILRNLDVRFDRAGIASYRRKILDLTGNTHAVLNDEQFDGIILDAPCTGSGTWSRTPEMISAFDERHIATFADLQRSIAGNAVRHLKPGKPLIYITCSVFAEENERTVSFLQQQYGLQPEKTALLTGYRRRADTLFVARMIKP